MTTHPLNKSCYYLFSLLQKHKHNLKAIQQVHSHLTTNILNFTTSLKKPNTLTLFNFIAFYLFKQLQTNNYDNPIVYFRCFDGFTYSFLIKACANLLDKGVGLELHCLVLKCGYGEDVYVQTALVNMYVECGCLMEAYKVFEEMPDRNLVTWNVVITGFVKWGEVEFARRLFDSMVEKNVVTWTGIVDGYTRVGDYVEALLLFRRMVDEGIRPSELTLLAVLPAIWNFGGVEFCQMVHAYAEKSGISVSDVRVINCLIDAYSKSGSMVSALGVFEGVGQEKRNLVSWTSIISGYAMHGMGKEASDCFSKMENEGQIANRVTFLSVLNACSHGGLVDEGVEFFRKMVECYRIEADIKHYGALIDLLGRAGRLREAEKMALEIPPEIANVIVWRTLLGSCSFHGNVEMGERVTRKIMELESKYGGDYVLLSNIFAGVGRHVDSENVRKNLDEQNAFKLPGRSVC
ncbi:hypothetical protein Leryth_005408 [Lithospermum erythrorhizon]|nr:hypothetical protein Leryth_005408 [Lithospermum erythrorhizon]